MDKFELSGSELLQEMVDDWELKAPINMSFGSYFHDVDFNQLFKRDNYITDCDYSEIAKN